MSLVVANRVQETCTSPGVGAVSLLGDVFQFIPFSSKLSNGDTTFYVIADQFGANWETGLGTYASSGNTIARTTVLSSSNGGALVNFSSGTQNVWNDYPAEYAIYASNNASQVIGQTLISGGAGVSPAWGDATSPPGSPGYYGQFYDTTIQTATLSTVDYLVGCALTSIANGVSISAGIITVANAGVYNFQFSIQLTNPTAAIAETTFWVRYNGVDIADSASTTGVPIKHGGINGQMILSLNQVFNMAAGDYLELWWHSNVAGVLIETLPATTLPTVPQSPGVIFTMLQQAQIGIGYNGLTSATSILIGTGSKTFTTNLTNSQTAFVVGTRVRVAYSVTPADFMEGVVTAFTGTTFTVNVDSIGGAGTFSSWTVSVAGIQGSNGVTSFSGNSTGLTPSTPTTGAITLGGTLAVANGGTGGTTSTGTGSVVLSTSPTFPVAIGTAPFVVTSTTPVTNLNIGGNAGTVTNGVYTTGSYSNPSWLPSVALTTGTITTTPSSSTDIVNKSYADSIASGVNFHAACNYATTVALAANTYNNGTLGVGATLTGNVNGAVSIDSSTPSATQRVLIKNEVTQANNGVYTVTQVGTGLLPYILTRATDYDSSGSGTNEIDQGDMMLVLAGSTNANTSWVQQTPLPIVVGTTALVFLQFAAVQTYTAGTGLTLSTNQFSITNAGTSGTYGSALLIPVITTNAQGQVTSVTTAANPQGTVTSVTGTAPVVSSGGTTPAISMAAATTSVPGYLTAADWTTFNNKGSGSVTSVGWTGGIVSIATATTTPAFTIAGTSGGIPYFSSGTAWATSAVLATSALVVGGGAGAAPSTVTTGTGVLTALGIAVGTAGSFITTTGTAALATSIAGQTTNGVLYQSGSGVTTSTAASTAAGQVLTTATLGGAPTWVTPSGGGFSGGTLTSPLILAAGTATNGTEPLRLQSGTVTTTPAAGTLEFDGTTMFSTAATGNRGVAPSIHYITQTAAYTTPVGTSNTLKQLFNATTNGAMTSSANTTYFFECMFYISAMSGTSTLQFGFLGTAVFSSALYMAIANKAALAVQTASSHTMITNTAKTPTIITASNATATGYAYIYGKITVTTAGTIIPAFALSTAAAAVVNVGSFFKIWEAGSNTELKIGDWT